MNIYKAIAAAKKGKEIDNYAVIIYTTKNASNFQIVGTTHPLDLFQKKIITRREDLKKIIAERIDSYYENPVIITIERIWKVK